MYKFTIFITILFLSGQLEAYNGTCPSGCECNYISVVTDSVVASGLEGTTGVSELEGGENDVIPHPDVTSVWVECSRLKPRLQALPPRAQLPENIFALDVTLNDVEKLEVMDSMETLTWFSICGNYLRSLSRETFSGAPNLRYLDLKDNNISDLPDGVFDPLSKLEILDLSHNNLRHLPVDSLKFNTKLRKLNLASNPLRIVHPEWFSNLVALKELNLAQSELLTLLPDTFKFTPSLEIIDLSKNLFKTVPSFSLKLARNLKSLIFNHNLVEKIDSESFSQLSNLEEIELSYNSHLIEIQLRSFYNLNKLKVLRIEHNPDLSHLDTRAFIGMAYNKTNSNLQTLSLAGNRFNTLPKYALNWCNLKTLDLRENPWNCDCNLEWTLDCASVIANPKCAAPSNLRGVILYHVPKEGFGCETTVDLSKDGAPYDFGEKEFKESSAFIEQAQNIKFVIMLFAVTILFFLGLAIAVTMKRNATLRGMKLMKRGSGSIYYMKTPTSNNQQPNLI